LIVDDILDQGLAYTLGDAAVNLPLADHRVDHHAEIVDGDKAIDVHPTGFRIDLNFAHLAAIRVIGRAAGHAGPGSDAVEPETKFQYRPGRSKKGPGDVADRHALVGPHDREGAGVEFDV